MSNNSISKNDVGEAKRCSPLAKELPREKRENSEERNLSLQREKRNDPSQYLPYYLKGTVFYSHGDFFVSRCFDPRLIAQLMCEGFLPIATNDYLLPKLHKERCIICPLFTHCSKSTKKKLKRYKISINQAFDEVVEGCHKQHGTCWLYPKIVAALRFMHRATTTNETNGHHHANDLQKGTKENEPMNGGILATLFDTKDNLQQTGLVESGVCIVRLYSIEVWREDSGELAAGELGYSIGNIYTSLTGFSSRDGAGSVQLVALGNLLQLCGFKTWDLGMDIEYKKNLGAQCICRDEFLNIVHGGRIFNHIQLTLSKNLRYENCREIYDNACHTENATKTFSGKNGRKESEEK
mmetsp:Transcript_17175/g.24281  ORF Transcript_17175/g.24281 Transcript_17175/m.24281 type:complete len:352 (-) Transcript_17175:454-1509(-)